MTPNETEMTTVNKTRIGLRTGSDRAGIFVFGAELLF